MIVRKGAKRLLQSLKSDHYETLNLVTIHRKQLLHNIDFFRQRVPGLTIIPVLKSNAYGHGLVQIAEILNTADIALLAIDGYFEAAKIRDITNHRILVMGYILPSNVQLLDTKRCSFVVQDKHGLEAFGKLGRQVRIHLELNTGMNRLGIVASEINDYLAICKQYPNLELEGVMTHLADADNPKETTFSQQQIKAFDQAVEQIQQAGFHPKIIHAFQTAGALKVTSKYATAFRLGIGLYGINPLTPTDPYFQEVDRNLQPVLALESTIIKTFDLEKGERVSYNGIFTAPQKMKIAVLPLGYYEAIPRTLSNRGVVSYHDKQLPIVGRVCMNHTMIDITGVNIQVGDHVMVINKDKDQTNSIAGWHRAYDLFSYDAVASLSESIRRVII